MRNSRNVYFVHTKTINKLFNKPHTDTESRTFLGSRARMEMK